jgi:serine/threonine protein kinase
MLAQLRHKNVVPIIEYNLEDNPPWFVMPRALFNLKDYLKNAKSESKIWVFYDIATGISYAHDNGIIHRDLKPENVLFFKDQNNQRYAAVSDFGLGRLVTSDSPLLTKTHERVGTYEYMAPEQYKDPKNVDYRADIYALGKILYEILTGELPYPAIDYLKVPLEFVYIIQKSCQGNPADRYRSVKEMLNDLTIITQNEKLFTKPAEMIRNEMRTMLENQDFTALRTEKLARLFMENTKDNDVLTGILPKLQDPILQSLIKDHTSMMITVLKKYDEAVSGNLPFEYCDIVADYFEKIFISTNSDELKVIIIKRLHKL